MLGQSFPNLSEDLKVTLSDFLEIVLTDVESGMNNII